ncbi:hypothetical protein [Endozoicomonas sp. SESOKO1]|uniref:hypothetical protein n=1 Tax=Endozoicomonas sp. SESOKO1 TaxID=2828742 RepID=UPI002148C0A9|nr:hypothetical protein [Endozoicomonas sp. SESOKO1]
MQPLQNSQASNASIRSAMDVPCTPRSDQPVQRKLEICHYKTTMMFGHGEIKSFPFILNGKTYHFINQKSGCHSVSINDEVLLENFTARQEEKNNLIAKRLSDVITKGFENVCTVLDDRTKIPIRGICHDFAHYLSLGFTVFESTRYKDHDAFYESLPNVKVTEFTGEQDLSFGDIVQITAKPDSVGYKPLVYHSVVYLGDGIYISKISGLNIYIQDLDSILDICKSWKKGSLRVIRDVGAAEH